MGDTPAMEERRRKLEESTGTFDRFSFVRLLDFIKQQWPWPKEDFVKVEPLPSPDPNMFSGTITLSGPALGSVFAGNDAWNLRQMGMEIADNVPDCAIMTKMGTFEWYKIEFNLKPEDQVEGPPTKEQRLAHLPNVHPRCPDGSPDWDTHMRLCGGCEDCVSPKETT